MKKWTKEELKERLTDIQYKVTQKDGTEPPFKNQYWDNKEEGIYVDIVSGEPLFSSLDKYDSGTGWPSFSKPIDEKNIRLKEDRNLFFQVRTEVRSQEGDSHLGHVFSDGPKPTGQRYCMNSAALRFIPKSKLKEEGYEKYLSLFETNQTQVIETAIFGAGCFWGVEDILRKLPGVLSTEVGYAGGDLKDPGYKDVTTGESGHAEVVKIKFDSSKLSYKDLLSYFFRLHDPTTKNRQGNDVGSQYRSVIFYFSEEQKRAAEEMIKEIDNSQKWSAPVVTEVMPEPDFYSAEEYHQDYLVKNPGGYTCHFLRE